MKLTYDPRYNVAYIRLHEKTQPVETLRISDELNVDVAPDGTVYGIELLNANEQLAGEEGARLVLVNSASDAETAVPLDLAPPAVREKPTKPYGQ